MEFLYQIRWRLVDLFTGASRRWVFAVVVVAVAAAAAVLLAVGPRSGPTAAQRCDNAARRLEGAPVVPDTWSTVAEPVNAVVSACPGRGATYLAGYASRLRSQPAPPRTTPTDPACVRALGPALSSLSDNPVPGKPSPDVAVDAATAACGTPGMAAWWRRDVAAWVDRQGRSPQTARPAEPTPPVVPSTSVRHPLQADPGSPSPTR